MQVVKESVSPCQVSLEIEVDSDKVSHAVDQAYREFSRHISVPGFRKGKAPLSFVKPRVPEEQLKERTAELLVDPAYKAALQQESVTPYGNPELSLLTIEVNAPDQKFAFKALVPLPPHVVLGEYKGIQAARLVHDTTDEDVDSRIDISRKMRAEYNKVDRAAANGDVLVCDMTVTPEDASEPGPVRSSEVLIGDPDNLPGLDQNLIGLKEGDDKAFQLTFPEDFPEESRGKTAGFFVIVKEIREMKLPLLDDEFAKTQNAATVEELRAKTRAALEKSRDDVADGRLDAELVDKVVAASTIDYPKFMRDREVEADVKQFLDGLKSRGLTLEEYFEKSGETEENLIATYEKRADIRLRRGLVIGTIASTESLQVTDEDVDAEIAERAGEVGATPEIMRAYLDSHGELSSISQTLITKKVLGLIKGSAIIEYRTLKKDEPMTTAATSEPEAAAEKPEKAKPRTRKPKSQATEA